ncbi:MAG: type II 3-dehydroquinate dehydratase [Marinifilaceae bacterium]|jgi:3-dehydroquinate dehydratase-2
MKIIIINGPNLNLIGTREKDIYGKASFEDYLEKIKLKYSDIKIEYYQSNIEGELINKLQEIGFSYDAILLNAGGYTHTSVAIRDTIAGITSPVVEIHISNILSREEFRHTSLLSAKCKGSIMGFGLDSYRLGIESIL